MGFSQAILFSFVSIFPPAIHNHAPFTYHTTDILVTQNISNIRVTFAFFEQCIVIYLRNKNQQNAQFFINDFIQLYCLRHVSNNYVFIFRNIKILLKY